MHRTFDSIFVYIFVERIHVILKVLDISVLWSIFFFIKPHLILSILSWEYAGFAGNDKNVSDKIGSSNGRNAMIIICIMHLVGIVFRLVCLLDYSSVWVCLPEAPFVCSFGEMMSTNVTDTEQSESFIEMFPFLAG